MTDWGPGLVEAGSPEESRQMLAAALERARTRTGPLEVGKSRRRPREEEPEERFRLELREFLLDDGRWVFIFQRPSWDPHTRSMKTAIDGFHGWLDLTIFRLPGPAGEPPVMATNELKVRPNRPTPEQWAYMRLLRDSGVPYVFEWTPDTMDQIKAWLSCPYGVEFPPAPAEWLGQPGPRVQFPPLSWLEVWRRHQEKKARGGGV